MKPSTRIRYLADATRQPDWYVLANRTEAVIFRESGRKSGDHGFEVVERLSNEIGKAKETQLVSDRPGRA